MKNIFVVLFITLSTLAFAKQKTSTPGAANVKLSPEDKQAYSQLDIEDLRAQINLEHAEVYKRAMAAHDAIAKYYSTVYNKYGITPAEYTLCEGPSQGPCSDVLPGEIDFRKKSAPPAPDTKPKQ